MKMGKASLNKPQNPSKDIEIDQEIEWSQEKSKHNFILSYILDFKGSIIECEGNNKRRILNIILTWIYQS